MLKPTHPHREVPLYRCKVPASGLLESHVSVVQALSVHRPGLSAALIAAARIEARELLPRHEHVVRALANQLQPDRSIDGAAIDQCIARAIVIKLAADER